MKIVLRVLISIALVGIIVGVYYYFRSAAGSARNLHVMEWLRDPQDHLNWSVKTGMRCGKAPFAAPTDGFIGYLWDDSFRPGHRHQGIDIFGGTEPGKTPVAAAFGGYLTRLSDWKSSVIVRVPTDPLQPNRQIWIYYTHMADADGRSFISSEFPAGSSEIFIPAGTLLGYQGDYSGDPNNPVGVHLHFSIVLDTGSGKFRNELEFANTLDPSPYFEMNLNGRENASEIPACK
jgi:hypothetical protein